MTLAPLHLNRAIPRHSTDSNATEHEADVRPQQWQRIREERWTQKIVTEEDYAKLRRRMLRSE
jgi:hypothetical protein